MSGSPPPVELLPLVFASPGQALSRARALLGDAPQPYDASIAHQVIGIWQRDFGDLATGLRHLRQARALAVRAASADREADVLGTLGVALTHAGRTRQALAAFSTGVERGSGRTRARVLYRRAYVWWVLGRHASSLEDLRRAIPVLRQAGDVIWTARALTLRGTVHLALGAVERAAADFAGAERLWETTGQEHDKADIVETRGLAAFRAGDIPAALRLFHDAERRYAALGTPTFMLTIRRCEVLMAAGLAREALAEADAALAELDRIGGQHTRRAELLLIAARAANAGGDAAASASRARAAVRLFARQRRAWWEAHARLVLAEARLAGEAASPRLVRDAAAAAGRLAGLGSPAATEASLLAGRAALALGRTAEARPHLADAARGRLRGPAFTRAQGWTAQALRAESEGSVRGALAACGRGLDLLDEHRLTLGAAELRAWSSAQGRHLAAVALRVSLRTGDPRRLLVWSDRWRAAALAAPPVRPPGDPELLRDVTALREIGSRAQQARSVGAPVPALEREQRRLEAEIRGRALHLRGASPHRGAAPALDVSALLERLGTGRLVELAVVDGSLHVLLCGDGRVRRFPAGRLSDAVAEAEHVRAGLRRLAHPGGADRLAVLEAGGSRLQDLLLGAAAGRLGSGPVVIVPPGRLHAVPWAVLPALRDRAVAVSPSASGWLRARSLEPPAGGRVVLARGPGLASGGAEVPELAGRYGAGEAVLLEGGAATAGAVLAALDGALLAHVAAHGSFRADSPMFSSLRLADGPLTVHDFERLGRSPYRIVLSSCDSGRMAPVGADELLGLAAALLPLGTAGIVASGVPVNDDAAVDFMLALHAALRAGSSSAEAVRDARREMPRDPVHRATGWAFTAVGAA